MIHTPANPLPVLRDGDGAARILMQAQRACERNETVAYKLVSEIADLFPYGRCNGKALDPYGQRHHLSGIPDMLESVAVLPITIQ